MTVDLGIGLEGELYMVRDGGNTFPIHENEIKLILIFACLEKYYRYREKQELDIMNYFKECNISINSFLNSEHEFDFKFISLAYYFRNSILHYGGYIQDYEIVKLKRLTGEIGRINNYDKKFKGANVNISGFSERYGIQFNRPGEYADLAHKSYYEISVKDIFIDQLINCIWRYVSSNNIKPFHK